MTPEEATTQLIRLDERLGVGQGAVVERAKLLRVIEGSSEEPKPKKLKQRSKRKPAPAKVKRAVEKAKGPSFEAKLKNSMKTRDELKKVTKSRLDRRR